MTVLRGRRLNGRSWLVSASLAGVAGNSVATLSSATAFDSRRVFNRDVYSGNPAGFSTAYGKGWGAVLVTITPSAAISTGLWLRLHDASDAAANPNAPGTGALLQAAIAVAGVTNLAAGANTVNLIIPAGLAWFYADLALDSAMTNPRRIAIPFGVGHVTGIGPGTSHGAGLIGTWAYEQSGAVIPPIDQMVSISPYGVIYGPYQGATYPAQLQANTWQKPGPVSSSPYASTFAAEYLRLCINRLGVVCAIVGDCRNGGDTTLWAPYTTNTLNIQIALSHADYKWDAQLSICSPNDAGQQIPWYVTKKRLVDIFDNLQSLNQNREMAVVTCATPLWDGGGTSGYRPYKIACREVARSRANTVDYDAIDSGGKAMNGHATMQGRLRWAPNFYRYVMGLLGPAKGGFALRRGPRITAASRNGAVITCTVAHDGGTTLVKHGWQESDPNTGVAQTLFSGASVPDAALPYLYHVYPAGAGSANGTNISDNGLPISSVVISGPAQVTVTLAADPGSSAGLDLYHGISTGTDAGNLLLLFSMMVGIKDDTSDGDGIPYGRDLRPTLDPVYVPAPVPIAQAITVSPPLDTPAGAWLALKGVGSGAPLPGAGSSDFATSIEVSVGGRAYVVPTGLVINNKNTWSGFVQAPATTGSAVSVAVRRVGQTAPDATISVNIVTARNSLPDPDGTGAIRNSAVAMYDALNLGKMWQDAAATIPAAQHQPVRALQDALGTAGNVLLPGAPTDVNQIPYLNLRARNWRTYDLWDDATVERPSLQFDTATAKIGSATYGRLLYTSTAPMLAQMTGDCTVLLVFTSYGTYNNGVLQFAKTSGAPKFSWSPLVDQAFRVLSNTTGRQYGTQRWGANDSTGTGAWAPPANPSWYGLVDTVIIRYQTATGLLDILYRNGDTGSGTLAANATVTWNTFMLGAVGGGSDPQFGSFRIHELDFFNRRLTDTEASALMAYSAAKWPY